MTDEVEPSKAIAIMTQALEWAYERATTTIPELGFDSAVDLAESHLKSSNGDRDQAIDSLIIWYVAYAGAVGFASNVGGVITMPVAIPANVASVLILQLRMVAAIAHLRGYSVRDEQVKTLAFISLTGSGSAKILQEFGISLTTKLTTNLIMKISGATLKNINQAVGFRLITKAGTTGSINLIKFVPVVGGLVGGAFDATVTHGIGAVAKNVFKPIHDVPPTDADTSEGMALAVI